MYYNPTSNAVEKIYPLLTQEFTSLKPLIVDFARIFAECGIGIENSGEFSGVIKLMEDVGFVETKEFGNDFLIRRLV